MIEKMKLVCIVGRENKKDEMIYALREMGILHLSEKSGADEKTQKRFDDLFKLSNKLNDYINPDEASNEVLDDNDFDELFEKTEKAIEKKSILENSRSSKLLEIEKLRPWGDFSPDDVYRLSCAGIDFHFYKIDKKELNKLALCEEVRYIKLSPVDKTDTVAVIGNMPEEITANEFVLPEKSISTLQNEVRVCEEEIAYCEQIMKKSANLIANYQSRLISAQNDAEYSAVSRSLQSADGLVWLKGYFPESDFEKFTVAANQNGWAYSIETVEEDDGTVPTKVKYNKLTGLMKPIFDILGTVPGYGEYDISFWFLTFFTLFFAMIIGDAGYGLVFLIASVGIVAKMKRFTNATLLLTVLSVATVVWGALTGTWFGLEGAMKIPLLKALVIPNFANYPQYFGVKTTTAQNSVMKFCFSIGVIQLALACVMNIRRKISKRDLSFVADIGWLMSICALYFMVLYLVIGQSVNITVVAAVIGTGFVLVVLFGGMSPEKSFGAGLKSGLADIFTVFLNTISAFGNVMSYIRLFAVGMASLAIAQSFNDMSSGFGGALVIVGAVIMIIGHLLNIVMGFLSVVVHGVRLNLLEFSGQLGMEWSGTAYEPFSKSNKLKK